VTELKSNMRHAGEDIIDLGMGNPDLPTPKHIVEKLIEAARNPRNHRYSASRGIPKLRLAICNWYKRKYGVELDPDGEAIATIGAKEGLSHLVLATMGPGDIALVPSPTYPIHTYSVIIAGADIRSISLTSGEGDFMDRVERAMKTLWPRPKMLILSFPHNPTTEVVDLEFFRRVIAFAKENELLVVHDLAYADLVFDGYKAPSFLQVPGAKDVGVEFFTLSKSYSMPGWRVGFCVGNRRMIRALTRIKSYLDYGIFTPIQVAGIIALNGEQSCVEEIRKIYQERRDALVEGLRRVGWKIEKPKATMFVWAEIPEKFKEMGSLEFAKGDTHVRFALVENPHRIKQAVKGIKNLF
jgi:alanine-synthesizing transaminase